MYPVAIQTELIEAFFAPWHDLVSRKAFLNAARVAPFIATLVFATRAWKSDMPKLMVAYHLRRAVACTEF
jgi:hypothetical protein